VGSLDPAHHFKGLDILIDAVHDLRDLEWRLTIVGDGVLRPHFERRAEDRRLKDRIHFAGGVSDADLPKYYRAADVHVLPSTGAAEAFGLVAIEAAASGIPSVASDLPGVRTVVRHDKTGLLVRPGSAIVLAASLRSLLERPDQRKALGAAARRRAEDEFSWDPLITRLEHTYRDVLTTGA
jgi:glycosyltransferase involved in cell wall biosynthesis